MNASPKPEQLRTVIPTEQIQKRVREMARQISNDYQGKTIHALALLENGFIFMADLVRALEVPVICQFIKPKYRREQANTPAGFLEIFFSHELEIVGQHVLLIEGLVHSGVTTEFLMNDLRGRGASSVKVALCWIGNRLGECNYSRITSASWWTKRFWWAMGWDRPSRRIAICPTWRLQAEACL